MQVFHTVRKTDGGICIVTHDLHVADSAGRKISRLDGQIVADEPLVRS